MNKYFVDLISMKLQNKYCNFINEDKSLNIGVKHKFLDIIENKSDDSVLNIENKLKALKIEFNSIRDIHKLANPYYIGFGNPDASILFLGKEKGFDIIEHPDLFIKESINNILHWEYIIKEKNNIDHKLIYSQLGFNPMFPRMHNYGVLKKNHTWYYYSKIVAGLKNLNPDIIFNETKDYKNSFFCNCFISEINYIPSKYSKGNKLNQKRRDLLQHAFFRKFKRIIIAAKSYLQNDEIVDMFYLDNKGKEIEIAYYGKNKPITITKYENNAQIIIRCDQLSGARGWPKEAIKSIINNFK